MEIYIIIYLVLTIPYIIYNIKKFFKEDNSDIQLMNYYNNLETTHKKYYIFWNIIISIMIVVVSIVLFPIDILEHIVKFIYKKVRGKHESIYN